MSFIFCPLYKLILNDDIKNRILNKIKELQCHSEWNTFDLHINVSDIEISSINIDDILKQRNIWKNIAKLSIDLWRDFDYYQQFIFKSKCNDEDEYKKRLESLGCVCEEGAWRSVSRPSEEVVQTSVFMYCLYEMMVKEKIGDIGTVIDNKSIICIFCDSEIEDSKDNCNICCATKEEREDHQKNIDNEQNKQIHNKEDNDECKINEDEEERVLIKKKKDCLVEDKSSQTAVIFKDVSLQTFCNVEDKSSQTLVNIINIDEHLIKKVFEDGINEVKYNDNDKLKNERRSFKFRKADKKMFFLRKDINNDISTNRVNFEKNNLIKMENRELKKETKMKKFDKVVDSEYEVRNSNDKSWNVKKEVRKHNESTEKYTLKPLKNKNNKDESSMNEKNSQMKIINDKWKCGRCECLNEYTFINCKACEGLYEDGKWNCGKCTIENSCIDNKCSDCGENNVNIKNERRENDEKNDLTNNENDIKEFMMKNIEIEGKLLNDKWKCGECECLNDYIFDCCKACGGLYKDGKWNCGKCRMGNNCVDDKCRECGVKNVNVEIKNKLNDGELLLMKYQSDKGNEVELNNDQWRCGRCGGFQLYNFTVCNVCNESRIENGLWKCSQCSLVNKCGFVKCTVCGVMNYQLLIKYCEYCKKNIVNINEARCGECARNQCNLWQCGNINCRVFNTMNFVYCYHCNLWRYNSYIRGEPVKLLNNGCEISVLLCQKCYKFDNEASQVCSYCGETRYEKRFCMDCNVWNDGKTLHCNKCHIRLC